jgi:hypothetical protein
MLAAASDRELKTRVWALGIWLVATIILVLLSLQAFRMGWPDGARQILMIASSVVGSGGLGILLGERSGAEGASGRPAGSGGEQANRGGTPTR